MTDKSGEVSDINIVKPINSPLAQAVVDRLVDFDQKHLGGLRDKHLKFLIMLIQEFFQTKHYKIVIDFLSNPKKIIAVPLKQEKTPFSKMEWVKRWWNFKKWCLKGNTIPQFLGLQGWDVEFSRVCDKDKLEARNAKPPD